MSAESRRGNTDVTADCVICGAEPEGQHVSDGARLRAWARRHVAASPGCVVHVETTSTRVYRAEGGASDG